MVFGISSLVDMTVHGVHSFGSAPTLSTGAVDRITDAVIAEPAGTTLIKALPPGSVEFSGGGQDGVLLQTG